ncbi:hypothetical protein ACI65C_012952 [Semiaphis heraclei]
MAAGVKKVIISAPSKDAPMFVKGVNFDKYTKDMTVVSNASCTTNCAAPLLNIINKHFGVEHCLLTTVHAMTSSQPVLDGVKQRSAAGNMVHSTTGAAKAVGIVIPELKGKVNGDSIRVPVLDVSLLKLYISASPNHNPPKWVIVRCQSPVVATRESSIIDAPELQRVVRSTNRRRSRRHHQCGWQVCFHYYDTRRQSSYHHRGSR